MGRMTARAMSGPTGSEAASLPHAGRRRPRRSCLSRVEASCTKAEQREAKLPIIPGQMGSDADVASEEVQRPRLQRLVFSGEEIRSLDLPAVGTMSIGRDEESAVRIDDLSVSRNHAVLHVGPKLVIEDLGSANGTMVRERAGQGAAGETLN